MIYGGLLLASIISVLTTSLVIGLTASPNATDFALNLMSVCYSNGQNTICL